jgi:integrase
VLGDGAHRQYEWPSLHEVRSLSARLYHAQGIDVQTLLGHKHAEMTEVYKDDRGLSRDQYKRVTVPAPAR